MKKNVSVMEPDKGISFPTLVGTSEHLCVCIHLH